MINGVFMKNSSRVLIAALFFTSTSSFAQDSSQDDFRGSIALPQKDAQKIEAKMSKQAAHSGFYLHLKNDGGFIGYYTLTYHKRVGDVWTRFDFSTESLTVGLVRSYWIPEGAGEMSVAGHYYTGLIWHPDMTLFSKSIDIPQHLGEMNFSMWGTVFNPQWNYWYK